MRRRRSKWWYFYSNRFHFTFGWSTNWNLRQTIKKRLLATELQETKSVQVTKVDLGIIVSVGSSIKSIKTLKLKMKMQKRFHLKNRPMLFWHFAKWFVSGGGVSHIFLSYRNTFNIRRRIISGHQESFQKHSPKVDNWKALVLLIHLLYFLKFCSGCILGICRIHDHRDRTVDNLQDLYPDNELFWPTGGRRKKGKNPIFSKSFLYSVLVV